ncbi:hypothetical protein [Pseudomonas sp. GM80]|uniref:hypothetical protein n=1 Tax=Pseudomonas sp. GM80 TaxID=1144339 RepID=UPI0005EB91B0|nr:hypothetical protein [Pseudomonas sp. GM80]
MDFKRGRDSYAYPCVGLAMEEGTRAFVSFPTTMKLDEYHRTLLRSKQDEKALLGYLSVLYWGHYSGAAGIVKANRALAKTTLAVDGRDYVRKGRRQKIRGLVDFQPGEAVAVIRCAVDEIDAGQFGKGVKTLCALPQLQFAFASKLAAFIAPDKCGVIDSVIVENNPSLGFALSGGYISGAKGNYSLYQKYCEQLQGTASSLNEQGETARWLDRDGQTYAWRAIDVERAMYAQKSA